MEVVCSTRGPLRRNDVVKGLVYVCDWLQDSLVGDYPGHEPRPIVICRTRAIWVPDAGILFQWPLPKGPVQISEPDSFPPSEKQALVGRLEDQNVPYSVIRDARRHLARLKHVHGQEAVLQQALDRLASSAASSESRFQVVCAKAGLQ